MLLTHVKLKLFHLLFFVKYLTTYDNSVIFEYYLELIQMTWKLELSL